MGIRINENIFSLFVNRNLLRTDRNLQKAFQRLSSGERITLSGDDPAGLANSQALRAKITGLQRNLMNSNEGLNLLSVAESNLSTVTQMLQRIRELAIQASSDAVSDEQRLLIQKEVDQLIEEIDRVAVTANYNDKSLLDGTFTGLRLQVGTRIDESIPVSIESARSSVLGSVARVTGALTVNAAAIAGTGDLTIDGQTVPASVYDGVSAVDGDASAIAKANAINSLTTLTGVTAKAERSTYSTTGAAILGGSLDGVATALIINGVNIGAVGFIAGDADGVLRQRINGFTSQTGVEASRGPGGELVLRAADGRNYQLQTIGSVGDELGLLAANGDVNTVVRGTVTLTSPKTIQVGGTLGLIGFAAGQATTFIDPTTAIDSIQMATVDRAQQALEAVDVALQQLLERRAALGALESRLNQTIEDLMVSIENLMGSDSRIRDADFAVETTKLTQAQVLQEAGIAILSQANIIPRMALDLLQR
ncbi:MAG TPA: flagellin [Sumerlaeia bacterium]|nr:flagellin [Sumerlaeia bacterium]